MAVWRGFKFKGYHECIIAKIAGKSLLRTNVAKLFAQPPSTLTAKDFAWRKFTEGYYYEIYHGTIFFILMLFEDWYIKRQTCNDIEMRVLF